MRCVSEALEEVQKDCIEINHGGRNEQCVGRKSSEKSAFEFDMIAFCLVDLTIRKI